MLTVKIGSPRAIARQVSRRLNEPMVVEIRNRLTLNLFCQIRKIEKSAFPRDLRYSWLELWARSKQRDFRILTLSTQKGECVGFCFGYAAKDDRVSEYFVDAMVFAEGYRKRRVGSLLMPALEHIKALGYESVCIYCDNKDVDGADLVSFYQKLGFVHIDYDEESGHKMELSLI